MKIANEQTKLVGVRGSNHHASVATKERFQSSSVHIKKNSAYVVRYSVVCGGSGDSGGRIDGARGGRPPQTSARAVRRTRSGRLVPTLGDRSHRRPELERSTTRRSCRERRRALRARHARPPLDSSESRARAPRGASDQQRTRTKSR